MLKGREANLRGTRAQAQAEKDKKRVLLSSFCPHFSFDLNEIMSPLLLILTELGWSRWLDIGPILSCCFYGPIGRLHLSQ